MSSTSPLAFVSASFTQNSPRARVTVAAGQCSPVCLGGLVGTGGVGFSTRAFGYVCDQLVEAECVLADGSVVVANASNEHADLFRAIKGAGAAGLGVITRLTMRVVPAVTVLFYTGHIQSHGCRHCARNVAKAGHDGTGRLEQRRESYRQSIIFGRREHVFYQWRISSRQRRCLGRQARTREGPPNPVARSVTNAPQRNADRDRGVDDCRSSDRTRFGSATACPKSVETQVELCLLSVECGKAPAVGRFPDHSRPLRRSEQGRRCSYDFAHGWQGKHD